MQHALENILRHVGTSDAAQDAKYIRYPMEGRGAERVRL